MEAYDFNRIIDRRNTNSLKFDFALERGYPEDVLPLWVADMDFRAPEPVLRALHRAVDHGIFGYSDVKEPYFQALKTWFQTHFAWEARPEWLIKTPGVVFAIAAAIRAMTAEGDGVLIQTPVYYPFRAVIEDQKRRVVDNPLRYADGRYEIDFEDFERKITDEQVKVLLLCSPHNPVGRVWTAEELRRMGRICREHGVYVISDEIHCDFTLPGHSHTAFFTANPELMERTVLCTAPSKTFNLAGLQVSNIWIPGERLRRAFQHEIDVTGYSQLNTLGLVACQAAYAEGGDWLDACKRYLQENLAFLRTFLREHLPEIRLVEPEGTYFAWLDCSALGLSQAALNDLIIHRARLWLDAGHIFGAQSGQFQRVVLACPRKTLEEALRRLERAVRKQ